MLEIVRRITWRVRGCPFRPVISVVYDSSWFQIRPMIKRIFNALAWAARVLLRDWRALIILFVLYLAMLGAIYLFFVTREATVGELILSLLLALAAPVLFLIIQTMAARHSSKGEHAWNLFVSSLRDFWKLLVIAVPLILVAVLAIYLFGK